MKDFTVWLQSYRAYVQWNAAHDARGVFLLGAMLLLVIPGILAMNATYRRSDRDYKWISIACSFLVLLFGFFALSQLVNYSRPEPIKPYSLGRQVSDEWGLSGIDCDADLDIHRLPGKDLRCTVDKGGRTIKVTLHVDGKRIGLYDERGKALE